MARPNAAAMKAAVKRGQAMPAPGQDRPGRFNIRNRGELSDAISAVGRAGGGEEDRRKVRRFIMRRARALNASDAIPDNWAGDGSLKT
jgi:hypothetical protein